MATDTSAKLLSPGDFSPGSAGSNDFWWNGGSRSGVGSALGGFWNEISGASQMAEFNAAEAQKNRDWQQYMSDTAYQRQIADMKAAGINPASVNADGASTPSGSAASGSPSGSGGILGFLSGLARSAIGAVMTKKMIDAGSSDRAEYRKMMGEYYSAKNALAEVHESKNQGRSVFYTTDDPGKRKKAVPSRYKHENPSSYDVDKELRELFGD